MYKGKHIMVWVFFGFLLMSFETTEMKPRCFEADNMATKTTATDSIALTNLIRKAYTWHHENPEDEFPYLLQHASDSIFIGIDWKAYETTMAAYKQTGYFTDEFFLYHELVATDIDASIKSADISWRNLNDGIPLWYSEVDDWCNCQDNPDDYWKTLVIDNLRVNGNMAFFNLNWEFYGEMSSMDYHVTAKKEEGKWKINSLAGYKNYYSKDEYDQILKGIISK